MNNQNDIVLYVDDEVINLELFKLAFVSDYTILTTTSTKEARELIASNEIKVVISDLRMPEENGIEFINSVSPQYPDIFYIILTAYLDVDAALKAINQGNTFRYLLKPWEANQIRDVLNNAIYSYKLKNENKILFNQLKERERQFYNIFYYSSDGIIIFNQTGQIIIANPAFMNIMGLRGDEDMKLESIFKGESLSQFNNQLKDVFTNSLPTVEYQFDTDGGNEKFIEINSNLIDYNGQQVALSLIRDITEWKLGKHKTVNAVIHAEERERNRLAGDLHDGIGPILSAIKMYVEWLADKNRSGNHDQILDLAGKAIVEAIAQVRTISHNLSPHVLEKFGLLSGLQSYIDLLKQTSQIDFNLNSNLKSRLKPAIELTFYRALKECINNTLKYAQAKTVYIVIMHEGKKISVIFTDDGIGFNSEYEILNSKGIGLYNIKNRIESLGGTVEILSAHKMGTRIRMEIKNLL